MTWEELLERFRALGGVAENVVLANGRLGRGLFPIDPAKPVRLHAPENLLVPANDIEIVDGQLAVKAGSALGAAEREFFRDYQRHFGWGSGLYEELRQTQEAWSKLPQPVVAAIHAMSGLDDPAMRFQPARPDVCLYLYIRTRYYSYKDSPYITPMTELANHASAAAGFVLEDGIGVAGTFPGEVFVRYNVVDSWARVLHSTFSDTAVFANSIAITIDISERQRISIGREAGHQEVREGIRYPQVTHEGNLTKVSFLQLGFTGGADLPRAIFRKIMAPGIATARADEIFDSIAHFNRTKFLSFLRTLEPYDGPVIAALKEATINQLETLSYCVGARTLP